MGLESYLLNSVFIKGIELNDIISVLEKAGATFLNNKLSPSDEERYRSLFFEIRSELGLTEIHILLSPNQTEIKSLNIRFSILSPSSVIDQTLLFLKELNKTHSLRLHDRELKNKSIDLDIENFKNNPDKIVKRQIIIDNKTGLVIEGDSATTDYIHNNNLMDKLWNS
jgi:hypothetical protein